MLDSAYLPRPWSPVSLPPLPRHLPATRLLRTALLLACVLALCAPAAGLWPRAVTVPSPRVSAAALGHAGWKGPRTRATLGNASMRGAPGVPTAGRAAELPDGLYPALIAAEQRSADPAYRVRPDGSGAYLARQPGQGVRARFTANGMTLAAQRGGRLSLRLAGYGTPGHLAPVAPARPTARGQRVTYRRGPLDEWYVNGPAGLEQGFTLHAPPRATHGSTLALALALPGGAHARLSARGATLIGAGGMALQYGQLYVRDRTGRRLSARLALAAHGHTLTLLVDARGAAYPLTVDPLIEPTATFPAGAVGEFGALGSSVALSQDGSVALVGAPGCGSGASGGYSSAGDAYIFTRGGGNWAAIGMPVATLSAAGLAPCSYFGASVALSRDGSVALIGAPGALGSQGAAYVFMRSSSGWASTSIPNAMLTVFGLGSNSYVGDAVALSGDGSTALVGADGASHYTGAAFVFMRAGNNWASSSAPSATLTDQNLVPYSHLGSPAALSADGSTVLLGANSSSTGPRLVDVFVRASTGWTNVTTPAATLSVAGLTASDSDFASAVAVSSDGGTALVGASFVNGSSGAAYVFARPGAGWSGPAAPSATLTDSYLPQGSRFGDAVALSDDGGTALVGGTVQLGSAALFVRQSGVWATMTTPTATLAVPAQSYGSGFGSAMALSGDGSTALAGAYDVGYATGVAYAFARPSGGWSGAIGTPRAALLVGGPAPLGDFGGSVALSGDGSLALVGAPGVDGNRGAAYLFTRGGSGWSYLTVPVATLSDGALPAGSAFGSAVALSDDGSVALVGAATAGGGTAYVFVRAGSAWASSSVPSATLSVDGLASGSAFGSAVALSGDGSTALIGAPGVNGDTGSAYVFSRPAAGWTGTLTAPAILGVGAPGAPSRFGSAVALSGDGSTALVGADNAGTGTGAAYIFSRTAGAWTSMGAATATLGTYANALGLGHAVALSADGSIALIGSSGANAAYVYTRPSGGSWGNTFSAAATLTVADEPSGALFGSTVALSHDGTIALIGAPGAASASDTSFTFTQPNGGWTSSNTPAASFALGLYVGPQGNAGSVVALSGDGSAALVGAPRLDDGSGIAFVYAHGGATWGDGSGDPTGYLYGSAPRMNSAIGWSVALSGDGSVALVGATGVQAATGAAYLFVRGGGGWSDTNSPTATLSVAGLPPGSYAATSVALSANGATALIGAPGVNSTTGAAYLFVRPAGGWQDMSAPTATLTDSAAPPDSSFGNAVALTGDGATALVGGYGAGNDAGVADIFVQPAGGWHSTGVPSARLHSPAGAGSFFGFAAALSSDGSVAAVTAPASGNGAGSAYLFTRPSGGWGAGVGQPARLTDSLLGTADFGRAVALSGDGGTALIGADAANGESGVAALFTSAGATWSTTGTPAAVLSDAGLGQHALFGTSVALSQDASVALVGAPGAGSGAGSVGIYPRPASGWASTATPTSTLDGSGLGTSSQINTSTLGANAQFGAAVALASDGNTALVGAPSAINTGAAQVFAPAVPLSGVQPIPFAAGWSLFTLPLLPAAGALHASDVLSAILATTHGSVAALYELSRGGWRLDLLTAHGSASGPNPILTPGAGYLLYSDRAGSYREASSQLLGTRQWTVGTGWNLEGLALSNTAPPSASALLSALLATTHGTVAAIYALQDNHWGPSVLDANGSIIGRDFTLQPGGAYLVYSDRGGAVQPNAVSGRAHGVPHSAALSGTALRALIQLRPPAIP